MSQLKQDELHPETFYDIQDDAAWGIIRLMPVLLVVYALSVGLMGVVFIAFSSLEVWLQADRTYWIQVFLVSAGIGVLLALFHVVMAYRKPIDGMLQKLHAEPLDDEDHYHKTLRNVVQEIALAAPVKEVRPMVIPTGRTNAMAVGDRDRAVIMITEGALGRLRRDELQAVVAHEMAHVAYGDSRLKFFTASILETFDFVTLRDLNLDSSGNRGTGFRIGGSAGRRRSGGAFAILILALITPILKGINRLVSTGISQQREWRADATAIEYCRDPLALASGLYRLGIMRASSSSVGGNPAVRSYRDAVSSPAYEPLLLVPFQSTRERTADIPWWKRLFESHPPLYNRIERAINLAGVSYSDLTSHIKRERQSPHVPVRALRDDSGTLLNDQTWWVHHDGDQTQVSLLDLLTGGTVPEQSLVAREGDEEWSRPDEHPELSGVRTMFRSDGGHGGCPDCGSPLRRRFYLGVPIEACVLCGGVALPWRKLIRLESRHQANDLPDHLGSIEEYGGYHGSKDIPEDEVMEGNCPECETSFRSKRFRSSRLVVDQCPTCDLTWFEEDELTIALNL